ncbi:hypothetical protein BGP79_10185 [Tersicoccus sp. Bi-70]|nr:hypothetical protein BGP79_10185 [Tersicoccus sp. Bi-70]
MTAASVLIGTVAGAPAASAAEDAPGSATTAGQVNAQALPTAQIDGVVWSQAIVGDTVYVGGDFATARPAGAAPGTQTVARKNLMAYRLSTGEILPFAPQLNAKALSVSASPDGSRVYVAGAFTQVDGQNVSRVAAFSTSTGARITSFAPVPNSRVTAVVATNTTVYLGGWFGSVGSATRTKLAAVNASNGAVQAWNPTVDGGDVTALTVKPDGSRIVVGGNFTSLNGSDNPGYGLGMFSTDGAGTLLPFTVNNQVRNATSSAGITSLSTDGTYVYGSAYTYGPGTLEGTFSATWDDGSVHWIEDCHGDTYSAWPGPDAVYTVGHAHYCGNIGGFPQTNPWSFQRGIAFTKDVTRTITDDVMGYHNFGGNPAPSIVQWFPYLDPGSYTGQTQAAWSVTGNNDYVVLGGEFPKVNGTAQQGLVRFKRKAVTAGTSGPVNSGANANPSVTSLDAGTVKITWPANWDRDDKTLTYRLFRDGNTTTPIYTVQKDSNFWQLPGMGFVDRGLAPGSAHSYRLFISDPNGNEVRSNGVNVTVSSTAASAYAKTVISDGASNYWRLSDTSTTSSTDWAGFSDLAMSGGITRGAGGAIAGDSNTATSFNGANSGLGATSVQQQGPNTFGVEAWFRTTSTSGGKIVGFGNANTGNSNHYDRHIYMDEQGRVNFGVYTGSTRVISTAPGLNDGKWHHVVANLSSAGMEFIVDARRVGRIGDVTAGENFAGYWRVGGDSTWAGANYFSGDIDDVAIYPAPLSLTQANDHWVKAGGTSTAVVAPADAYGARVFQDSPDLFWRLGENGGTTAADSGPAGSPGTYSGNGLTFGQTGAVAGTSNSAVAFDGSSGELGSNATWDSPSTYSLETWFNTGTTVGGKLIGFGSSPNGNSGSYDRHVYMQDDGRLVYGVWTGQANTITTPTAYNDSRWHHVVATQGSDGMKLYVDGQLIDTNPQTQAQPYSGYWRVGNDTTWGSSSSHFNGLLDEVAVYSAVLPASSVSARSPRASASRTSEASGRSRRPPPPPPWTAPG